MPVVLMGPKVSKGSGWKMWEFTAKTSKRRYRKHTVRKTRISRQKKTMDVLLLASDETKKMTVRQLSEWKRATAER